MYSLGIKIFVFLIQNLKGFQTAKLILKRKDEVGSLTLPCFKPHCKATASRMAQCCREGRRGQRDRTERPEINPRAHVPGSSEGGKVSVTNGAEELDLHTQKWSRALPYINN